MPDVLHHLIFIFFFAGETEQETHPGTAEATQEVLVLGYEGRKA